MRKIEQTNESDVVMLPEKSMMAIKNAMKKYEDVYDFFVSCRSMKKHIAGNRIKYSVVTYPISDIEKYYQSVVKPLLSGSEGITEKFFFDKITKIYFTDEKKSKVYTGYFSPTAFFNYIRKY